MKEVDPDIITGFNISGFDFPFLLKRAVTVNANSFPFLGRLKREWSLERMEAMAYIPAPSFELTQAQSQLQRN